MKSWLINKFYAKPVRWFMHTKFYYWILLDVLPYIRWRTIQTEITGKQYKEGYAFLKPGRILLGVDKHKLTTLLVPGNWTHAAFCVSKGGNYEVAEMDRKGYMKSEFYDLCNQADVLSIWECKDFDDLYVQRMIANLHEYYNAAYRTDDILAETQSELQKGLYCSGLVYVADFEKRIKVTPDYSPSLDAHFVTPDDLSKAPNMMCLWRSDKL